jgi:hypothetical protein
MHVSLVFFKRAVISYLVFLSKTLVDFENIFRFCFWLTYTLAVISPLFCMVPSLLYQLLFCFRQRISRQAVWSYSPSKTILRRFVKTNSIPSFSPSLSRNINPLACLKGSAATSTFIFISFPSAFTMVIVFFSTKTACIDKI